MRSTYHREVLILFGMILFRFTGSVFNPYQPGYQLSDTASIEPEGPYDTSTSPGKPPIENDPEGLLIGVTITVYTEHNCRGAGIKFGFVNFQKVPLQVQSYKLDGDLCGSVLDFWNALPWGGPLDTKYDGDNSTCNSYIRAAAPKEKKKGCHDLDEPIGCMRM